MKKRLKKFLAEKGITEEDFAKKSAEEMAELYAEFNEKMTDDLEKALEEKASKEDIEDIKAEIKEGQIEQYKALKNTIKEQGLAIAKLIEDTKTPVEAKKETLRGILEKSKEDLEQIKTMEKQKLVLEFKATQNAADIDAGSDFAMMESGVGQIATRRLLMKSLFTIIPTNKEYVKYNDQETRVRDAKNVAGCATSTHNSKLTWKVREMKIEKVRDFVDVCIDMMDDYDFVEAEIRELIFTDVALKVDEQLLLGDNVSPNLNSVAAVASTFAAGDYAAKVQAATLVDLITVCGGLISDAGENNKFMANVALLNPVDALLMKLEKDADNNYLIPNFVTSNGVNIGAIRVIENPLIPVNEMYVMDTTKGRIYQNKNNAVEFGFENKDNFEHETVTVKAYERLNFRVRNVDANAFLHVPNITLALAAITE